LFAKHLKKHGITNKNLLDSKTYRTANNALSWKLLERELKTNLNAFWNALLTEYVENHKIEPEIIEWSRVTVVRANIREYCENERIYHEIFNPNLEEPKPETVETPLSAAAEPAVVTPIQWIANNVDFAELVTALLKKGYIKADSPTEALRIAAAHFSGVGQNAKSLLQGISNRMGKAGKFDNLPEPAKPKNK
jgi:hypothetical protein